MHTWKPRRKATHWRLIWCAYDTRRVRSGLGTCVRITLLRCAYPTTEVCAHLETAEESLALAFDLLVQPARPIRHLSTALRAVTRIKRAANA
eukprot:1922138-Rhodomonas_salina.1